MRNTLCKLSYEKDCRHLWLVSVLFLASCNPWALQPYEPKKCVGKLPPNVDREILDEACMELSAKMGWHTRVEYRPTFFFTEEDPWQCNELLDLDISVKGCFIKVWDILPDGRLIEPGIYINGNSSNQKCLIKHEFAHYLLEENGFHGTRDSHGGSHHRVMKDIAYTGYICHRQ